MSVRALFSAISGLQSYGTWLDVLGNNISNVNTVAYKASRVEMGDQPSQALDLGAGASSASGTGGRDPLQVGTGSRVASIQTLFDQGPTLSTGNSTDLSIQGSGFLLAKKGDGTFLTRAGNLTFDGAGNLVDQNGGLIQGFQAQTVYSKTVINSTSSVPGQPAVVTRATLQLDNTNMTGVGNIRIDPSMTLPPKATSEITFKGNLDSFQQADQPGGILDVNPGGQPLLPVAAMIDQFVTFGPGLVWTIDTTRMTIQGLPNNGFAFKQVTDLSTTVPGMNLPDPLDNGFFNLAGAQALGAAGNYAWDQVPPVPPAKQVSETVYDSLGNPRQVSILFYQVNDLGEGGVNSASGPSQACYAWYAFETTGGQKPSTANLLGGTAIAEGNGTFATYDRGTPNIAYTGDFLWFNTDGSLASSGGLAGPLSAPGLPNTMDHPRVYLPGLNTNPPVSPIPDEGAENVSIDLNFGTFGLLTAGKRDGLFSDAAGSYQVVNGVNTYVPNHTAVAASQDGYPDGTLQSMSFDETGTLTGSFSNGQKIGLAQVVLAQADNPGGLNKVGTDYFTTSTNSGPVEIGLAGKNGLGTVQGGTLEGSNVDLSTELSNMISAQRGFDVNARMVATVNSELNTLTNLGRNQ